MSSEQLFSTDLISPKVQESLPEGYKLRPLQRSDYNNGHLAVLADLAYIGDISEQAWTERFDFMKSCHGTYFVVVIIDENREKGNQIVGTGTLFVEKKFLFKLGVQGHIEDVGIKSDQQGKKLGTKLLQALDYVGEKVGCYKTILDCSEGKDAFYVKCGYEKAGIEMHNYYDPEAEEHSV